MNQKQKNKHHERSKQTKKQPQHVAEQNQATQSQRTRFQLQPASIVCLASAILAIAFSIWGLIATSLSFTEVSLSAMGYEMGTWFILWGITTGIAIFLNLQFLASKLGMRRHLYRAFIGLIAICAIAGIIFGSIVDLEPSPTRTVHIVASMIFGITSAIAMLFILIYKLAIRKGIRFTIGYLVALLLVGVFTGFSQIIMTSVALLIMLSANFVEQE